MVPASDLRAGAKASRPKAKLRGISHSYAAIGALSAGIMLISEAHRERWSIIIYVCSLVTMYVCSATYHQPTWGEQTRLMLRKLDHAAIFLLIAGTYTPLCVLGLDLATGHHVLKMVWVGAALGVVQSLASKKFGLASSKLISSAIYIALGWIIVPYSARLGQALGQPATGLIVAGGIVYSLGGLCYALKFPDPSPEVFGYHEVFHAFVIVASMLHFAAVRITLHLQ